MPDLVLSVIGGALIGSVVYLALTGFSSLIFKNTSQQSIGVVRFGYGAMGAVLGAVFGLINIWVLFLLIRLLGTIAGNNRQYPAVSEHRAPPAPKPAWVRGVVSIKESFEHGSSGAIAERVDPIPEKIYATLGKAMQMLSNEQAMNRFLAYPGIKPLIQNARIAALQKDPAIMRDMLNRDFMGLLRNEQIVKAVNDPEIVALIGKFDIEKALDYAISKPENRDPVPGRR
ncbi:MAG: Colicin production protein [Chthoniobacteraceae bacterium]|nr:Colicin production protein [Chthoniobacteraceae bacterium]